MDVGALTQNIIRKVYANMMEQLASRGIQISIPPEGSPGAAGKSRCTSKEVEPQVAATVTEPDTIDLLEGPTPCNLKIRLDGYHIEVARG